MLLRRGIISSGLSGESFVGLGDVVGVPSAAFAVSNQRWNAGLGTNNAEIRVIAATSDIGYDGDKFSGPEWDTATTSGANDAFTTTWYDQISTNNPVQAITINQPLMPRTGVNEFDGGTQRLISPYSCDASSGITIVIALNGVMSNDGGVLTGQENGTIRDWVLYSQGGQIRFRGWRSTASAIATMPNNIDDGSDHFLVVRQDPTLGVRFDVDGVSQTVTNSFTGNIDNFTLGLGIGSHAGGGSRLDINIGTEAIYESYLSDQNITDLRNQWVINDAL